MEKASAAPRVSRRRVAREASRIWNATANPDGPGLLERGREFQPCSSSDFDPVVLDAVVRLARLVEDISGTLRDIPAANARRSLAVLTARAHPIRVALDD